MFAATLHSANCFVSGVPLPELLQILRGYLEEMSTNRQDVAYNLVAIVAQLCANLMGDAEDPTVLTGEFMKQETAIQLALDSKNTPLHFLLSSSLLTLSYLMDEHLLAEEHGVVSRAQIWAIKPGYGWIEQIFHDGLDAVKLSSVQPGGRRRKQLRLVRKNLRLLKKAAVHAPSSCLHKVNLLGAELDAATGNFDAALWKYQLAMSLANSDGFIQNEALACELFAFTLLERNRFDSACRQLERACSLHATRGCRLKVDQLRAKLVEIRGKQSYV